MPTPTISQHDPLKIRYCVVLDAEDPHEVTPFQGFSRSWSHMHWALRLLVTQPSDILERTHSIGNMVAHRMGGTRSLFWFPLNITALEQLKAEHVGVFLVCFSPGQPYALQVAAWAKQQTSPVLHVTFHAEADGILPNNFTDDDLRAYCRTAFDARTDAFSNEQKEAVVAALQGWTTPVVAPSGLVEQGHNITLPNYMAIQRAHLSIAEGKGFVGDSERAYSEVILNSAAAALSIRQQVGLQPIHRLSLLRPPLILAEPAFYRARYARMKPTGLLEDKVVFRALRSLQTQKGLYNIDTVENIKALQASREARLLISMRQAELETFTLGLGLHAAQTCAGVVRLSPGVNHVFSALAAYAGSVRSQKYASRLKARRLFRNIQEALSDAVGKERLEFIDNVGGPIKIVSDAPIEWLPIKGLPLSLRYDCSRINATPGNLMMGELIERPTIIFEPKDLAKVLVLSAFTDADPIRNLLTSLIKKAQGGWDNRIEIIYKTARNVVEFIDAMNEFDGHIMIFDGHGVDNSREPVGKLLIGKDEVDVWELRGRVRMPPIVILSACDTHGLDASSQATVGNGFLAIGVRTVLATLLPVGGISSAIFIARLLHRIADFLPAALKANERTLDWGEVMSGMLRMLLAFEIVVELVDAEHGDFSNRESVQMKANTDINSGEERWFENLIQNVAEVRHETVEAATNHIQRVIAYSEAIRYIQLGNPEAIKVSNDAIRADVMRQYDIVNGRQAAIKA
jgi:hypothetical protein